LTGLIHILSEQAVFGFTGRINIILKSNRQFLGAITQNEGLIVDAQYKGHQGKKALFTLIIEDRQPDNLSFIIEPEIIDQSEGVLHLSVEQLKKEAVTYIEDHLASQKLKPSKDLVLTVHPDFIVKGEEINGDEFSILCTLTEFSKVGDLYENSPLLEHEVTKGLVGLRKKGALRVFKNQ
jgi:hypothetical protein